MTFAIIYLAYRKPGTSPAHFRAHYDNNHMPKIKQITGQLFPLSHVRKYVHRTTNATGIVGTDRNPDTPATLLSGVQADFDYDAIVEMTFEDEAAFQAFYGVLREPGNAEWIARDEEIFLDRAKTPPVVVLGDVMRLER